MAKILLVDDAAFMRMMLKTTLGQAGYTDVIEAAVGSVIGGCVLVLAFFYTFVHCL